MIRLPEVRRRCRYYAQRFDYPLHLFDRFPMHLFRYFRFTDALSQISPSSFSQLNIATVFMIINNISADLMMTFYSCGGQDVDTLLRLQTYFQTMWRFYQSEPSNELLSIFGTYFAFHCETRTLRRIDMSVVSYRSSENTGPFLPTLNDWRRSRAVRHLIRSGQFEVNDDYDLLEVQLAYQDGLRQVGRANNNIGNNNQ